MSGNPAGEGLEQRAGEGGRNFAGSREAEETLRESEAKYRKIFENIQDVFYQTDFAGNIIEISPTIKRHTGFTREELIGQSILKLYHDPEDREKLLATLLKKGEVIDSGNAF